jgi:hypothetical protein
MHAQHRSGPTPSTEAVDLNALSLLGATKCALNQIHRNLEVARQPEVGPVDAVGIPRGAPALVQVEPIVRLEMAFPVLSEAEAGDHRAVWKLYALHGGRERSLQGAGHRVDPVQFHGVHRAWAGSRTATGAAHQISGSRHGAQECAPVPRE